MSAISDQTYSIGKNRSLPMSLLPRQKPMIIIGGGFARFAAAHALHNLTPNVLLSW